MKYGRDKKTGAQITDRRMRTLEMMAENGLIHCDDLHPQDKRNVTDCAKLGWLAEGPNRVWVLTTEGEKILNSARIMRELDEAERISQPKRTPVVQLHPEAQIADGRYPLHMVEQLVTAEQGDATGSVAITVSHDKLIVTVQRGEDKRRFILRVEDILQAALAQLEE